MKKERFVVVNNNVSNVESVVTLDRDGVGFASYIATGFNTMEEALTNLDAKPKGTHKIVKLTFLVEEI